MKTKLSITVDESVVKQIEEKLQDGIFRNRSHVLEYAVKRFLKE